ncbi:MAG: hypothetical protein WC666_02635 [Candidatus Paceibacterota bacterium]|jgi:hypothetical protein
MKKIQEEIDVASAVRSWVNNRFVMRSGFYAGREPSENDLNSRTLEMFYSGLRKDISQEAATNFVRFVNKLHDLSASAFIVAFENFWQAGCTTVDIAQDERDRSRLSGKGKRLEMEAFCVMAGSLFGGEKMDESSIISASNRIKHAFIQRHIAEIPADEIEK